MKCTIFYNNTQKEASPNKMTFFEELYFDYKIIKEGSSERLSLFIHPKQNISLEKVVIEIPYKFTASEKVLCNGFQSWSETKMYKVNDKIPRLRKFVKPFFKYYGDEYLFETERPDLYSWTYGYVQNKSSNDIFFIGSLIENSAFTLIEYDTTANMIRLIKLCDNIDLAHSFPALDCIVQKGKEKQVFDNYFASMEAKPKMMKPSFGWTSWYRHYTKVSAKDIAEDLKTFSEKCVDFPFDKTEKIFQLMTVTKLKLEIG